MRGEKELIKNQLYSSPKFSVLLNRPTATFRLLLCILSDGQNTKSQLWDRKYSSNQEISKGSQKYLFYCLSYEGEKRGTFCKED